MSRNLIRGLIHALIVAESFVDSLAASKDLGWAASAFVVQGPLWTTAQKPNFKQFQFRM